MTTTDNQHMQPDAERADAAEFLFYCDMTALTSAEFLFYCDMTALTSEERTAHQELISELFGKLVQETRGLPNGYAYRFDNAQYPQVATFITNEQLCCPFLTFDLTVTPHRGPVWLQLTAPGDVKLFLREELGHYTSQH